jgi:hypothetical protein
MSKVLLLECQVRNIIKGVKDQKECLNIRMFMKYENITTVYLVTYVFIKSDVHLKHF